MAEIKTITRGMVVDVNLDPSRGSETGKIRPGVVVTNNIYNARVPVVQIVPLTEWSEKKAVIATNIPIVPSSENGLTKRSIADCLQTRPVDKQHRILRSRGRISDTHLDKISQALRIVFGLD
jgi:mRNA interferase MazF